MEERDLQINDVVYAYQYGQLRSRLVVTRVTEKRAFAKVNETYEEKFYRRTGKGGYVNEYAPQKWNSTSYYLETPVIKAEWERAKLIGKVQSALKLDITKLTDDQLSGLLMYLDELNQHT